MSIIIPHYKEPDAVVDLALSSIKIQAGVDFSKIQIVIVNDHLTQTARHSKTLNIWPTNNKYNMDNIIRPIHDEYAEMLMMPHYLHIRFISFCLVCIRKKNEKSILSLATPFTHNR